MSFHREQWIALGTTARDFVAAHPSLWYAAGLVLAFFAGVIVG